MASTDPGVRPQGADTGDFRRAALDLGFFGRHYLPHYFTRPSPPFHRELDSLWRRRVMHSMDPLTACREMQSSRGLRTAVAAPRDHAKSTVISLKNALHATLYGYKQYLLLISDTESQATGFLESIKYELKTNARLRAAFGDQTGKVWRAGSIVLQNGYRIDAVGSGQKVRDRRHYERRPDLILCDDIENDEGVRTAEQRQKTADWFWKAVCKSGDSYTDILAIGTILHHDSLLANLLENPGFAARKYRAVLAEPPPPPCGSGGRSWPRSWGTRTGNAPPTPSSTPAARRCSPVPRSSGRRSSPTTTCGSCA